MRGPLVPKDSVEDSTDPSLLQQSQDELSSQRLRGSTPVACWEELHGALAVEGEFSMSDTNVNPEVPQRTADTCTLPNGEVVWIQTLNELHKADCDRAARRYAALECKDFAPGGPLRAVALQQVQAMSAEDQAMFLAQELYRTGEMFRALDADFPPIPEPERGEGTEAAFVNAHKKWRKACDQREVERRAKADTIVKAEVDRCLALQASRRVASCVETYVNREFASVFISRIEVEELYRAVRQMEDHSVRYYRSAEEVYDLDDRTRETLLIKYAEIDGVRAAEVPTSPAG